MRPVLRSKAYLYMTEFFAGMSVMAVELGASRLLAPYFSSSQIVWTIIIGTIMIAMALGNLYGGRRADRDPNPDRLYRSILIAAVWIALIPVLGKYVIVGVSAILIFSVNSAYLVWAAFAACMLIFVFPLFLLGTVTPSLAKYTMENLEDNARIVGTLGAANTIGSIIGTFVPTFVTIPAVGTAVTFLVFAGILLLLALIYFFSAKPHGAAPAVGLGIFLLSCALGCRSGFAFWKNDLLYEGESVYNYLQVEDTEDSVIFSTNVLFGVQSVLPKDASMTGMYYDYALAAPLMAGVQEKLTAGQEFTMLILGMGTGTYGSQCAHYFPSMQIEGVEIDSKITWLAREYFGMPEEMKVCTYDGRAYLNTSDRKYDVIMVDAYQDITIPFHMSSVEFFRLVRSHLKEDGVLVVNMNMRGEQEGSINRCLSDTIAAVFSEVCTVDVPGSTNRELFASDSPELLQVLERNIGMYGSGELADLIGSVQRRLTAYEAGDFLLTDDCAPVELLGMQVIDELIRDEVYWYKQVYETYGIEGVLGML
ncbi:MAG: fused MFS/spermidine synthase [Oscillospiraceae bacterium]|nr:fused MFS/spermidine synthase [Oscillospiraceae bacterium]